MLVNVRFAVIATLAALSLSTFVGSVRAADQFLPGATVTATSGDKKLVTTTDEDGFYSFPELADGVWTEPGMARGSRISELSGEVDVQPVDVGGQTVLLCARGGKRGSAAMDRAARGVARILATAA